MTPRLTRPALGPAALGLAALLAGAACGSSPPPSSVLAGYRLDRPLGTAELPRELTEVSGLAADSTGRLFAHDDERAVVHELDRSGRVVRSVALDGAPRRADYEGIALVGTRVWLVTSAGLLVEAELGSGPTAAVGRHDAGIGRDCEVEGLAYEPAARVLLLACKHVRPGVAPPGAIVIYRWAIDRHALATPDRIVARPRGAFHPSGIERDPTTGRYLLVAGPERAIAEVTPEGGVVAAQPLRHHRQPEGITLLPDRTLLVSDEGAGRRGRVTAYAYAR